MMEEILSCNHVMLYFRLFFSLHIHTHYTYSYLQRFYRFHESQHERAKRAGKRETGRPRVPYWHVFKKAFPQLFNVFMVFFVTLAVFPAVLAGESH